MPQIQIVKTFARVALCCSATVTAVQPAGAQSSMTGASTTPAAVGGPADPSPYYVGVAESLTHESNAQRIPGGRGDNHSTTSLLAGFLQPIGRQQVYGAANVGLNRYQDETGLNNTSYALSAGANWQTIWHLSGGIDASMGRNLSAPAANAASLAAVRNVADTRNVDGSVRWGGVSVFTLEANAGWSSVDYSGFRSNAANSRQSRAGLGLYFRPGGPLTLGLAGRFSRTESPSVNNGVFGPTQPNTVDSRNLDFIAGYTLSGLVSANGRLSYTKQTSATFSGQDFSGLTGGLSVSWLPTAKTAINFNAARDAGSGAGLYSAAPFVFPGAISATGAPTVSPGTTPTNVFYENSRVTDSFGVGATHATTAKIALNANARYARARVVAGSALSASGSSSANTIDTSKSAAFGATYAISRSWNAGCNLSREWRDVRGGVSFAYRADSITCSTQLTLR